MYVFVGPISFDDNADAHSSAAPHNMRMVMRDPYEDRQHDRDA